MRKIQIERNLIVSLIDLLQNCETYPVREFYAMAHNLRELAQKADDTPNVTKGISVKIDVDVESAIVALKRLQDHLVDTIELTSEIKGMFK